MGASDSPIREGARVPQARLHRLENGEPRPIDSQELFAPGRTVVAFALPGAFTPTCSSQHLPRYEELAPTLRAQGVDAVVCLSVNDPFVMSEWGRNQGLHQVQLIADGNAEFAQAMGMLLDDRALGMGLRSRRYSMLVRDGRIDKLFVEPDEPGDPYTVSDADTMLDYLAPGCRRPSRVAIFTKPGCPHCARAKRLLEEHGLAYEEIALDDARRARLLAAVAGAATAPQVFIDGRHIGDSGALEAWLAVDRHD